ncbi:MAG: ThuA domain-containing protein [Treponema sp.]|nr:ThuA domain-containing protein [Treponema sp.]
MLRVTVWNEGRHEQTDEQVRRIYPEGIHGCIASFLKQDPSLSVRTACFDEAEHGLSEEVLKDTDVLVYWSHMLQEEFSDAVARRAQEQVLAGMGLVALHSAHYSKLMRLLMGTTMTLRWRHGDRERLFVTSPSHPIAAGLPPFFELPQEEMYGEYFDIPKPDDVVFTGWFAGGEVFRSGCTFQRGKGRIFYFQPGHEEYPIYHDHNIQQVIRNAVYWAGGCCPQATTGPQLREVFENRMVDPPLEKLSK